MFDLLVVVYLTQSTDKQKHSDLASEKILDNKNVPSQLNIRLSIIFFLVYLSSMVAGPLQLPEGQGKAAVQKICSGCHAPEIVVGRHETKDGWVQVVSNMVDKGANGTDDEFNQIIDYLAAHFGKNNEPKTDAPGR